MLAASASFNLRNFRETVMPESIEHLVGFGTIFGGALGMVPFSIAHRQGKKQFATIALIACLTAGISYGEKLALPVFTTLSVVAIASGKNPSPKSAVISVDGSETNLTDYES
jgi:VIT1/CCC1 family predicted Fe2+/Mn2+ transporter